MISSVNSVEISEINIYSENPTGIFDFNYFVFQQTKDEVNWGLSGFKNSSGDAGSSPLKDKDELEKEHNETEDILGIILGPTESKISPLLEKEMDIAIQSAGARFESLPDQSKGDISSAKQNKHCTDLMPQPEIKQTPTKSSKAQSKSSSSSRRSSSKSPARSQGRKSMGSSQNSVKSPLNQAAKSNRLSPKVSEKPSPVKTKSKCRLPKNGHRPSPKSRPYISSSSSSSSSCESESEIIDVEYVSPKTAKQEHKNKDINRMASPGMASSGHRKREKRKSIEKKRNKSRSKSSSRQSTPVKAESSQVLKLVKMEHGITSPVKEHCWTSPAKSRLMSPMKSREYSPALSESKKPLATVRPLKFDTIEKPSIFEAVKPMNYHAVNVEHDHKNIPQDVCETPAIKVIKPSSSNMDELDDEKSKSTKSLVVKIDLSLLQRIPGREVGEIVESSPSMHSDVFEDTKLEEAVSLDSDGPDIIPTGKGTSANAVQNISTADDPSVENVTPKAKTEHEIVKEKSQETLKKILAPSRTDKAPVGKIPKIPKRKPPDNPDCSPKRKKLFNDCSSYDGASRRDRDYDRDRDKGSRERSREYGERERDRGSRDRDRDRDRGYVS